jgi:hypothetical protein
MNKMYNLVLTTKKFSLDKTYKSIQDCMHIVDMYEDTFDDVQWNITKVTHQRGQYSPRQNKINRKK